MTETPYRVIPAAEREPTVALWFWYLFFRPKIFFRHFVAEPIPVITALAAWVLGTTAVMDDIALDAVQSGLLGGDSGWSSTLGAWGSYWIFCMSLGVLSGVMYFLVGGWWYRVRLDLCGADHPNKDVARRVYLFASQVYAIPAVFYATWETKHYESPAAALNGDDVWGVLIPLFLFWSVYASYRGVRTAFEVRKWAARVWFLFLPTGIYCLLFVGVVAGMIWQQGWLDVQPRLDIPRLIQRPGFTLKYPGNWDLAAYEDDFDPDHYFRIEPFLADAYLVMAIHDDARDPDELTREGLAALSEHWTIQEQSPRNQWGSLNGTGYDLLLIWDGQAYRALLFTTTTQDRAFQVTEVSHLATDETLEPGFELIRDSFRLLGR